MDNCLFARPAAHLRGAQPCAPTPRAAVRSTGTKAGLRLFLWITAQLCQNYPQSCAPATASPVHRGPGRRNARRRKACAVRAGRARVRAALSTALGMHPVRQGMDARFLKIREKKALVLMDKALVALFLIVKD